MWNCELPDCVCTQSKKPQCNVQIINNLLKVTSFFYTFTKKCLEFPLHKLQLLVPAYVGTVSPVDCVLSRSFTLPVAWGNTPFTSRFQVSWQSRGPEVEEDGRANSLATNIPRPSILALCSIKSIESTNVGVRQANLICSSQVNAAMSQYEPENFSFHLDICHILEKWHTKHLWTNFYVFLNTSTQYVITDTVSIMPQFYF